MSGRILVTGANGHLGRRLIERLTRDREIVAIVRSQHAATILEGIGIDTRVVDYRDSDALLKVSRGCTAAVHLIGIIKESSVNTFHDAHEASTRALTAVRSLKRIVYLSIIGAEPESENPCFASKAAAEEILHSGQACATILRVAMVLGEGDYASKALAKRAMSALSVTFRATSVEQPIYAGDVVEGIVSALDSREGTQTLELAGPERITRRMLIHRAASLLGKRTTVFSLPLGLGKMVGALIEKAIANPPMTRAMLGVLDHDDDVDVRLACQQLNLRLTPLDETLRLCLRQLQ